MLRPKITKLSVSQSTINIGLLGQQCSVSFCFKSPLNIISVFIITLASFTNIYQIPALFRALKISIGTPGCTMEINSYNIEWYPVQNMIKHYVNRNYWNNMVLCKFTCMSTHKKQNNSEIVISTLSSWSITCHTHTFRQMLH